MNTQCLCDFSLGGRIVPASCYSVTYLLSFIVCSFWWPTNDPQTAYLIGNGTLFPNEQAIKKGKKRIWSDMVQNGSLWAENQYLGLFNMISGCMNINYFLSFWPTFHNQENQVMFGNMIYTSASRNKKKILEYCIYLFLSEGMVDEKSYVFVTIERLKKLLMKLNVQNEVCYPLFKVGRLGCLQVNTMHYIPHHFLDKREWLKTLFYIEF